MFCLILHTLNRVYISYTFNVTVTHFIHTTCQCIAMRCIIIDIYHFTTEDVTSEILSHSDCWPCHVAEDFRSFREFIFSMLGLLRKQVNKCCRQIGTIETGQWRRQKEDCTRGVLQVINGKMGLNDVSAASIKVCHILEVLNQERNRPVLIKLSTADDRSLVWRAKSKLKSSPITIKEFLTRSWQSVFVRARLRFGISACWTYDGTIVAKTPVGVRMRINIIDPLLNNIHKQKGLTRDLVIGLQVIL